MDLCNSVSSGISFHCQQCGNCCSSDAEGYIFLYSVDVEKISKNLQLTKSEFAKKYLAITQYEYTIWDENLEDIGINKIMDTLVLNFEQSSDCVFLYTENEKKLCKIYQSRPVQCDIFPFWSILMTSEENYQRTIKYCKGLQNNFSNFRNFSPEEIKKYVYLERKIEKEYYKSMKEVEFNIFRVYPFLPTNTPILK
ncbi:MAG: YkgJ family cysteine cluster protein [Promethearchaeota archaeon]